VARAELSLDMRSIWLTTYEKQLEEAAAKVHRLERKLRHSELDEARRRHKAFDAGPAQAAQQADALQRVRGARGDPRKP